MRVVVSLTLYLTLVLLSGFPVPGNAGTCAKILVVGDSLSAGYGLAADESWVALLSARLRDQGYGYRVVNASITGDTTRGGMTRLPRALQRHSPELVIIELGGNDGLRGLPIPEIRANLSAMIKASAAAGARVLLLGMRIPPNYGIDYAGRFARLFDELVEEHDIAGAPFLLEKVALDDGLMQADGIHPNARAQPLMLDTVWPSLAPLLKLSESAGNDSKSLN